MPDCPGCSDLMKSRSWSFSLSLISTLYRMLGLSKLVMKCLAPARRSLSMISRLVVSSAVAVSATRGTPGNFPARMPSSRYSGRKSCPHWETQCASSIAKRAISILSRRAMKPSVTSLSGAT